LFAREAPQANARAVADFFATEPDLLRIEIYDRQGTAWRPRPAFVNKACLALLQLDEEDLPELRKQHPVSFATLAPEGDETFVENASLPPDAAVLTLAFMVGANSVVVADFRHERLLRIFGRSKLHETYLVDARGEVVAHPQGRRVIQHADLSGHALVQAALTSGAAEGVKEFEDADGVVRIGAFGRVGLARLWVLTQIPKQEALRASRELVARSALFAVAIVLAAFLVSVFFARLLAAPSLRLSQATEQIGQGHFDVALAPSSNDEIGDLSIAFARMARTLKETQAQLVQSEKLAAFGQLGAGITHEVKNPITSILGFTQLVRKKLAGGDADPKKVDELLAIVEKETRRCQDILVNFLKFARASEGAHEAVQVNEVVTTASRIMQHQLNLHAVQLEVRLEPDLPAIQGNAAELQQVLLNLAMNAQQAMPKGGSVVLATARDDADGIKIQVIDNGPGIPEAIRTKIFEPFFTTKPPGEGTGLGLSVSFGIIKAHHGSIELDTEVGKGSTFTIRLPVAAAA
ncbi:MAG TPA: ATP-binding protein, partial [Myxococcota bacterium]|nr:ATP-binding protein [Myxococcota bacterium]